MGKLFDKIRAAVRRLTGNPAHNGEHILELYFEPVFGTPQET